MVGYRNETRPTKTTLELDKKQQPLTSAVDRPLLLSLLPSAAATTMTSLCCKNSQRLNCNDSSQVSRYDKRPALANRSWPPLLAGKTNYGCNGAQINGPSGCANVKSPTITMSTTATMSLARDIRKHCKSASRLIVISLLVSHLIAASAAALGPLSWSLSAQGETDAPKRPILIDQGCRWSQAEIPTDFELMIKRLKCNVGPLFATFTKVIGHFGGPKRLLSEIDLRGLLGVVGIDRRPQSADIYSELVEFSKRIDQFYVLASETLNYSEFCTFTTISRLLEPLKQVSSSSKLLSYAFDLVSIDYHRHCLAETLSRLPRPSELLSEVASFYLGSHQQGREISLEEAIKQSRTASSSAESPMDEMSISLSLWDAANGAAGDRLEDNDEQREQRFSLDCKQFLLELERGWQSMDMMSRLLASEGNGIKRFNEQLVDYLSAFKYASICRYLNRA